MMTFTNEDLQKIITGALQESAEFVYLMGSAGTERFHQESDIDIAVFWKESTTEEQKRQYWRDLGNHFQRDVELVALNQIDIIFARQVLETGRLLINNDSGLLLKWKMEKLSEYPDFKTSRKPIEDLILNRKTYV